MTHATWNKAIKRGLALAVTNPDRAAESLEKLAKMVEAELQMSIHDWHLAQTRHVLSLVQTQVGKRRAAANTLRKIADQYAHDLKYDQRAFVSACAAAAVEFAKVGDRRAASRMLKAAEPWASSLRPKDKLLRQARSLVATLG